MARSTTARSDSSAEQAPAVDVAPGTAGRLLRYVLRYYRWRLVVTTVAPKIGRASCRERV